MKTEISMNEWMNRAEIHNNSRLDNIDTILANLKKDPEYYNHGMSEQAWNQEETRND